MSGTDRTDEMRPVVKEFLLRGEIGRIVPYGNGHINDTCLVEMREGEENIKYILQRINTSIFRDPKALMDNITGVTRHLKKKISAAGGDVRRETLSVVETTAGGSFYRAPDGECYRVYEYIDGTESLEQIEKPEDFCAAAEAFGNFQYLLSDYPAETLHEVIPDFHNTVKRYERFLAVLREDPLGRAAAVCAEVDFVKKRADGMGELLGLLADGRIPLRVTHNDTKLNNILLDPATGRGVCIIDLDTVMPGTSLYDFGDAIRFGASTALEDEEDVSLVHLNTELFAFYVRGYVRGCRGTLTEMETAMLPVGARLMTLECGMRFLTAYLEGDVYFKIHRKGHNLDRCRTQFALVAEMEQKWEQMKKIVREEAARTGRD